MDDLRYDALVAQAYQAAAGDADWTLFLDSLARAIDAWGAHLMGFGPDGSMRFQHEGGDPPAEASLEYLRHWHRLDPRVRVLMRAPEDRWVHCHEHLSPALVRQDPFYRDFLIPNGGRWASGMRFTASPDLACVLSVQRGVDSPPLDAVERQWMERLGRHVKASVLLQQRTARRMAPAAAGRLVIDRLPYPAVLLDIQGLVLHVNPSAEAAFARADGPCTLRGAALRFRSPGDDARVGDVLARARCAGAGPVRMVLSRSAGARGHMLHVTSVEPQPTLHAFGHQPALLLRFYPLEPEASLDVALIAAAFGLTPAEARVVVGVAEGLSDAAIAERSRVLVSTVKTHVRAAYAKMGVSNRAQVAGLLMAGPAFWTEHDGASRSERVTVPGALVDGELMAPAGDGRVGGA